MPSNALSISSPTLSKPFNYTLYLLNHILHLFNHTFLSFSQDIHPSIHPSIHPHFSFLQPHPPSLFLCDSQWVRDFKPSII
jgi:hypothetical protein